MTQGGYKIYQNEESAVKSKRSIIVIPHVEWKWNKTGPSSFKKESLYLFQH